ncbi:hypothetical protein LFM09_36500 [Lentzea alba]|uniref:hypothetical protein n=1 Tax=Lentzea alba TaxID=2714351 RepID=UPI0039BF552B
MGIRARLCRSAVAGAVSVALLLAGVGTAQAGVRSFQDGFESNPAAKWTVQTIGGGQAGFDYNINAGRSGQNNGWLHSGYNAPAGTAAAMGVWVSTGTGGTSDCIAQIYVNPLNDRSTSVNVEIFDSAGTKITGASRNLTFTGYQAVQSDWFQLNGYRSVFARFMVVDKGRGHDGEWLRLDDFALHCYY